MVGTINKLKQTYKCKYCEREFARESTLDVHVCEQKKRFQHKNDSGNRIGFQNYLKFYEVTQGSAKTKTFDDFATSAYYKAFVKYGNYCVNSKVINITRYTEWLLKNNKKIDHWHHDNLYEEFLHEYLFRENSSDALTRALQNSIEWAKQTGNPSEHFLRFGNPNQICHLIQSGQISGWVVFNSSSGHEFLESLNSEQLAIIFDYINPDHWQKIFGDYPGDAEYVKEMCRQAGW